jgi:hypothetical protein
MALLHKATLTPSKLELLTGHLATRVWFEDSDHAELSMLGSYRFDDPAGEVGIETHLLGFGSGPMIQVPLTYRAAPVAGADDRMISTMEHSALGTRWVYDACGDPVYVAELVRAILTGGTQVEQYFETDEGRIVRDPTATVIGSGSPGTPVPAIDTVASRFDGANTLIHAGGLEIVVRHLLTDLPTAPGSSLSGTWADAPRPVTLAFCR